MPRCCMFSQLNPFFLCIKGGNVKYLLYFFFVLALRYVTASVSSYIACINLYVQACDERNHKWKVKRGQCFSSLCSDLVSVGYITFCHQHLQQKSFLLACLKEMQQIIKLVEVTKSSCRVCLSRRLFPLLCNAIDTSVHEAGFLQVTSRIYLYFI